MKTKNRKKKPTRCSALHAALAPMADGCAATAALAYKLSSEAGYDKDAALALNLASDTLEAINKIVEGAKKP